jgi:hypothetical protein
MSPPAATSPAEELAAAGSAAEINPYAASAIAEPLVPSADVLGIGVWSDGDYLVLHPRAELPRLCVFTGLPASRQRIIKLFWEQRLFSSKSLRLALPLSDRWVRLDRLRWWGGHAAGLAAIAGSAWFVRLGQLQSVAGWDFPFALVGAITLAIGLAIYTQFSEQSCGVTRARGDYLWIGGPGRAFLAQLPPWPAEEA